MDTLEQQVDKILTKVINIESDLGEVKDHLSKLEETQEMTYRRIEKRLTLLETQRT